MTQGVDYAWSRPSPTGLYAAGKRFACRYASFDTTGKNLTVQEAIDLSRAGLSIVANWEHSATDQLGGYDRGRAHAVAAHQMFTDRGMPPDRPIYFSTDFNATAEQLETCRAYLNGAASILGRARVGVYGGYRTIDHMAISGAAQWFWQTYAWSAGRWHAAADIRQYQNGVTVAGATVDLDQAMVPDYGQWVVAGTQGKDEPTVITDEDLDRIAQRLEFGTVYDKKGMYNVHGDTYDNVKKILAQVEANGAALSGLRSFVNGLTLDVFAQDFAIALAGNPVALETLSQAIASRVGIIPTAEEIARATGRLEWRLQALNNGTPA